MSAWQLLVVILVPTIAVGMLIGVILAVLTRQLTAERAKNAELLDRLAARTLAEYHAVHGQWWPPQYGNQNPAPMIYDETGLIAVPDESERES